MNELERYRQARLGYFLDQLDNQQKKYAWKRSRGQEYDEEILKYYEDICLILMHRAKDCHDAKYEQGQIDDENTIDFCTVCRESFEEPNCEGCGMKKEEVVIIDDDEEEYDEIQ